MTNIVFTKKMAGVIYRAYKDKKIKMTEEEVKFMYDYAEICERSYSKKSFYSNDIDLYIDNYNYAIESIISNNYEEAQNKIDYIKNRNNCKKSLYA